MKKYSVIIILTLLLVNTLPILAQKDDVRYENRICLGLGGENGFLGIDYSRGIYRAKLFLGVGCGIGTGWTVYMRYEPLSWYGLRPFISSGISYSFGGTLIVSSGTTLFSASAGLNFLPKLKVAVIPVIGVGMTYYSFIKGYTDGGMNSFGPLIKFGIAFPRKTNISKV